MAFDYKKEYREFYLPKAQPQIVEIPEMRFVAVRGAGDPNQPGGAYQAAIEILYGISFTIKMSRLGDHRIDDYFDYVTPPLEGFWALPGSDGFDPARKAEFRWISAIRLPDFVSREDFEWAVRAAADKKKRDFSVAEFLTVREGLCVQTLHVGPFDDEPESVARMDAFVSANGYANDFTESRLHHEIYLSDFRKTAPEKRKTVLRHPIRRA